MNPKRKSLSETQPSSVFAVDLGGSKIASAVVGRSGRLTRVLEEPVDTSSPEAPVEQIVALYRRLHEKRSRIAAIGIAVPGLVRRDGTVWAPNLPGWDAVPLARDLRRRLRIPVAVESDRNAVVLGEAWRGAARGKRDVVVLIVGTGVGAGIMSDGRLIRGAHELSGCAGWMVVTDERGEETKRVGALEALVAGPAIAREANRSGFGAVVVAEAARSGGTLARVVFLRAARRLGLAVANLASLFDPEVIVLTGGIASAADLYLDELRRAAIDHAQPLSMREIEIVVSDLGARANLLGVARIAFDAAGTATPARRSGR
jgi:glucokinase